MVNKAFAFLIFIVLSSLSCADDTTLNGVVSGAEIDSVELCSNGIPGGLGPVRVDGGVFKISMPVIEEPTRVMLILRGESGTCKSSWFYVGKGEYDLSLAVSFDGTVLSCSILDLSGYYIQDKYEEFSRYLTDIDSRQVSILREMKDRGWTNETDVDRLTIEDKKILEDLISARERLRQDRVDYCSEIINGNDDWKKLFALKHLEDRRIPYFESEADRLGAFGSLPSDISQTKIAVSYNSQALSNLRRRAEQEKTSVGKPYIDFAQEDVEGNKVRISDLIKPGRLLLIDFWASWCGPCRAENPNLLAAYKKYHDRGFDVVAVSLDDDRGEWVDAIEEDGMPWIHLSDLKGWRNAAAQEYAIRNVPYNFLINDEGIIVGKFLMGKRLEDRLEKELD